MISKLDMVCFALSNVSTFCEIRTLVVVVLVVVLHAILFIVLGCSIIFAVIGLLLGTSHGMEPSFPILWRC